MFLQELLKNNKDNIKYWRTKTHQEVDFIIDNILNIDAIELKFKNKVFSNDFSWLVKFHKNYKNLIKEIYLVSKYWTNKCFQWVECENLFSFIAKNIHS